MIVAALRLDESTAFPGYAALLPVLGTATVIAGGTSPAGWGAGRLIGAAPFRFVGKLSYGWSLWHRPVLMIWPVAFLRDPSIKKNLVENPVRM